MPDIKPDIGFTVRFTDREFRLITKALANMAGLKASFNGTEKAEAGRLNLALLEVRRAAVEEMMRVADGTLKAAREGADHE